LEFEIAKLRFPDSHFVEIDAFVSRNYMAGPLSPLPSCSYHEAGVGDNLARPTEDSATLPWFVVVFHTQSALLPSSQ
jgi:hypothetical protein